MRRGNTIAQIPDVVRSGTHLCAYHITWSGSTKLASDVYAAIGAGASSNALSLHVAMLVTDSLPLADAAAAAAEIDPCRLRT